MLLSYKKEHTSVMMILGAIASVVAVCQHGVVAVAPKQKHPSWLQLQLQLQVCRWDQIPSADDWWGRPAVVEAPSPCGAPAMCPFDAAPLPSSAARLPWLMEQLLVLELLLVLQLLLVLPEPVHVPEPVAAAAAGVTKSRAAQVVVVVLIAAMAPPAIEC